MRLFLMLLCCPVLYGQNLIQNGDFERHAPMTGLEHRERFAQTFAPWQAHLTYAPRVCDTSYARYDDEENYRICPYELVKPHSGKVMVQMSYDANSVDGQFLRGNAPTLSCKLAAPMEFGKIYRISFWVFIREPNDPEYVEHIGCQPFAKAVRNPSKDMLYGTPFHINAENAKWNEWQEVSWVIRPLCNLNYFTVGVFRNQKGPLEKFSRLVSSDFFLDDISIQALEPEPQLDRQAIDFCYWDESPSLPEEISPVTCYFDLADSVLLASEYWKLDSFAQQAKAQPQTVFYLFGHTDTTGTQHEQLAQARINATLKLLNARGVPDLRFITLPYGAKQPAESNSHADGRSKNRRVEIVQASAQLHQVLYRQILDSLSESKTNAAQRLLNIWVQFAPEHHFLLALHDPRLQTLNKSGAWNKLEKAVQKTRQKLLQPDVAAEWENLYIADQWYRSFGDRLTVLSARFPELDSSENKYSLNLEGSDSLRVELDSQNLLRFEKLVANYGYPERTAVGKQAAAAAFLILQHQSSLSLREKYLSILYAKCLEGESEWVWYACLYDRLVLDKGEPQRYGTQTLLIPQPDGTVKETLNPIHDLDKVNSWRKEIGLVPFQY